MTSSSAIRHATNAADLPQYAERETLYNAGYCMCSAIVARMNGMIALHNAVEASGQNYTELAFHALDDALAIYAGYTDRPDATFTRIL